MTGPRRVPACAGTDSTPSRTSTPAGVSKSTSRSPTSVVAAVVAGVDDDEQVAAAHGEQPALDGARDRAEGRVGELRQLAAQPAEPAVAVEHHRVATRGRARPSRASSGGRSRGPAGRGPRRGPSPSARTRRSGPSAVALPSSGSGWEVKNCERRRRRPLLAHEQHRGERPGQRQQRGAGELVVVEVLGEPVAAGAVADLVVVLVGRPRAARSASCSVSTGAPWSRSRNDENVPSWKKPRSHTLASASSGSKSA